MKKTQSSPTFPNGHLDLTKQAFQVRVVCNSDKENIRPHFFLPGPPANPLTSPTGSRASPHFLDFSEDRAGSNCPSDPSGSRKCSLESWEDPCYVIPQNKILAGSSTSFGAQISQKLNQPENLEMLKRLSLLTADTLSGEEHSLQSRASQTLLWDLEKERRVFRDVTPRFAKSQNQSRRQLEVPLLQSKSRRARLSKPKRGLRM